MATTNELSPCHVLFVDDDAFYRDLASEALQAADLAHVVVPDGEAALGYLETNHCDLVVLDLSMPGRSGFEIVEQIRNDERTADLPIIVVTGNDDEETVARAFELGATSFMAKPLNWPLFVQHVRFVHKAAQSREALRRAQRTAEFMNDLKSRLIGTLLTEFQAPLRSAMNFARLLKEQADGPLPTGHYPAWVSELHTALDRLGTVHVKLLNFGRAAGQTIDLDDQMADVGGIVSSCVERFETGARRRNVSLTIDETMPKLERIRLDSILVANAISGILDHAVKFTPRGGDVVVTVAEDSGTHIAITIQDGVPPMSQTQIDEILGIKQFAAVRTEQIEHVTALKISRILIEAHLGELRMRAHPRGMITTIRLPKDRTKANKQRPLMPAATSVIAPLRRAG
jgi:two-component system, sensor histidine kinase and response regulator